MDELVKLREMIRSAEGSNRNIDLHIAEAFGIPSPWQKASIWPPFSLGSKFEKQIPAFTSSIDAALAFCVRLGVPWIQTLRRATFISGSDVSRLARAIVEETLTYLLEKEAANEAE